MILGFKGFKPGLIATLGDGSYQYQPGEVSKTEKAKCANTGFHYCLDPLDCLNWYAWDGKNEFWAIAAGGDIDEDDYRTRSSCTEIVPLRRLKEDEFLLMHANYVLEHPAEKFEDCFKRPFHIAYGQGKELASGSASSSGKKTNLLALFNRSMERKFCREKSIRQKVWRRC